jgi:hypothetical protein
MAKPGPKPDEGSRVLRELTAKFPKMPHAGAARKAYKQYPHLWPNQEACLTMVRRIRGKQGTYHRDKNADDKSLYETHERSRAPVPKMPESIKRDAPFVPFWLHGPRKILDLSDVHIPFHDESAFGLALAHGKKSKCDTILINGDFGDFYRISDHRKDKRKVEFYEERDLIVDGLKYVRHVFPNAEIVWKEGNHEYRLTNYLMTKAEELLDLPEFKFENFFKLNDVGITYVKDKRLIMCGKLPVVHGHEIDRWGARSVNAARTLFLRAKASCLQGHVHKHSSNTEVDIVGHVTGNWSVGCLCQLDPDWNPIMNGWMHGHAIINVGEQDDFEVENYKIIKGRPYLG